MLTHGLHAAFNFFYRKNLNHLKTQCFEVTPNLALYLCLAPRGF